MAYVEVGWTMHEIDDINQVEAVRFPCIEGNRFPIWNQELLYYHPSNLTKQDVQLTKFSIILYNRINKEKNIFYFIQFNLVLPEISFQASA